MQNRTRDRQKKRRGIALLSALVLITCIMIFFAIAVVQMQQDLFLTRKLEGETKAYWAAVSGIEYASHKIEQNFEWPFNGSASNQETYGDYDVSITTDGGKTIVWGHSAMTNSDFYMTFVKNIPADNNVSFAPIVYNKANLQFASVNNIVSQKKPQAGKLTLQLKVGDPISGAHYAMIKETGIYLACEATNGRAKSVVEKVMAIEGSGGGFTGAVFANNINVTLNGSGGSFSVEQTNGRSPGVIATGNVNIRRINSSAIGSQQGDGPLIQMQDGTIYTGGTFTARDVDGSSVLEDARVKHMKMSPSELQEKFPDIAWDKMKSFADSGKYAATLKAGSYIFMQSYKTKNVNGKPYLVNKKGVAYDAPRSTWPLKYRIFAPSRSGDIRNIFFRSFYTPVPNGEGYKLYYFDKDVGDYGVDGMKPESFADPDLQNRPTLANLGGAISQDTSQLKVCINYPVKIVPSPNGTDIFRIRVFELDLKTGTYMRAKSKRAKIIFDSKKQRTIYTPAPYHYDVRYYSQELESHQSQLDDEMRDIIYNYDPLPPVIESTEDFGNSPLIYSQVEFDLQGSLTGKGEIICGDKVTFESGASIKGDQIAIYAKDDVTITYPMNWEETYEQLGLAKDLWDKLRDDDASIEEIKESLLNDQELLESFIACTDPEKDEVYASFEAYIDDLIANNLTVEGKLMDTHCFYPPPGTGAMITGVVYTQGNFKANTDGGPLILQGIIVANGDMNISNCTKFDLRYDPSQMDVFPLLDQVSVLREISFKKIK